MHNQSVDPKLLAYDLTDGQAETVRAVIRCGSHRKAAEELGCHHSNVTKTLRRALESAREQGYETGITREAQLEEEIKQLKSDNRELRQQSVDTRRLTDLILQGKQAPVTVPKWVVSTRKQPGKRGTPVLMLSDLHWGETVYPDQVNGVNEYNLPTAHARLQRIVNRSMIMLRDELSNPDYHGITLVLGGDMVSGNIHEELRETNDAPVMECLLDLRGHLINTIKILADEFGRVFVPCVVGNHGRLDKKPRAKFGVQDNYEWMLYMLLADYFSEDERVTVCVPTGFDLRFNIHGTRYLLTHGDQFRGGSGITGPLLPWMRGHQKKQRVYAATRHDYDVLLMGHWHNLNFLTALGIIVNGSLKGYDEWSMRMNFEYQRPEQALWITDPKHGVWFTQAIRADEPKSAPEGQWVSIPAQASTRATT